MKFCIYLRINKIAYILDFISQIDLPVRDVEVVCVADIDVVWESTSGCLVCATGIGVTRRCAACWHVNAEVMASTEAWPIASVLVGGILAVLVNRHLSLDIISALQDPHEAIVACQVALVASCSAQPADAGVCSKDAVIQGPDDHYEGAFASTVLPEGIL